MFAAVGIVHHEKRKKGYERKILIDYEEDQ
jgi:hypothetical protein